MSGAEVFAEADDGGTAVADLDFCEKCIVGGPCCRTPRGIPDEGCECDGLCEMRAARALMSDVAKEADDEQA